MSGSGGVSGAEGCVCGPGAGLVWGLKWEHTIWSPPSPASGTPLGWCQGSASLRRVQQPPAPQQTEDNEAERLDREQGRVLAVRGGASLTLGQVEEDKVSSS